MQKYRIFEKFGQGFPSWGILPPSRVRRPNSHLKPFLPEKYSKLKSKGDDAIPIDSHMTNKEYYTSNFKFKTPISKLQIQDFKKHFEKKNFKTSAEWITEVMSQAAKEVTAGWNLTAFILTRMTLHACTILMALSPKGRWKEKKNSKKKKLKKKIKKKNSKKKNSKKKIKKKKFKLF